MKTELDRVWETIPSPAQLFNMFGQVSAKILPIYNSQADQGLIEKLDGSPQTLADRVSHEIITDYLQYNSGFPVLSEESYEEDKSYDSEFFWVVDPVDGTKGFIDQNGEFALMVSLVNGTKPVLGAVYHPLKRVCYFARKGQGSFVMDINGAIPWPRGVSKVSQFDEMRMLVSRHHLQESDSQIAKQLGVQTLIPHDSFGLKVGLIANGKAEIYLTTSGKTSIWDSAPNIVILEEAGGKITDLNGNDLIVDPNNRYNENGILATNGLRHEEILETVRKVLSAK